MACQLETELYSTQSKRWPSSGEYILAHFDDNSIIVYQAYSPAIAGFALANGQLGGPAFSFTRMSWIKTNFMWMLYRAGWATKPNQEVILGLRIRRAFFDQLMQHAVASSTHAEDESEQKEWRRAVRRSDVRLQWDPDHSPKGGKLVRRAVQLGLRGETLAAFATKELLEVIDMTPFVAAQRPLALSGDKALTSPLERVYVCGAQ